MMMIKGVSFKAVVPSISFHMSSTRVRLGLTPAFSILPWFLRIGVFAGVNHGTALFHSSPSISMSLAAHVPEDVTITPQVNSCSIELKPGSPIKEGFKHYWTYIPAIHTDGFWEALETLIRGLTTNESLLFSVILQPEFSSGQRRTLGTSFHTSYKPNMKYLREWLEPLIDNFEEQSGGGGVGGFSPRTYIRVTDITGLPEPEVIPYTASPANVAYIKDIDKATKAGKRRAASTQAQTFEALRTIAQGQTNILEAIKASQLTQTAQPTLDWKPIVQGVITAVAPAFGLNMTSLSSFSPGEIQVPSQVKSLEARLDKQNQILETLTSTINQQGKTMETLSQIVGQQGKTLEAVSQILAKFTDSTTPPSNKGGSSKNGSGSTPPAAPSSNPKNGPKGPTSLAPSASSPTSNTFKTSHFVPPEITPLSPNNVNITFDQSIVTADLEAIINQDKNEVYMAAWYNGKVFKEYNLIQYGMDTKAMLKDFWFDLLIENKGRSVYFHNWAGYDSILSLRELINLKEFTFEPVINNNEVISIRIKLNNKVQCIIIDSIKLLPSSLGRLAKDWKVETQKDHFPHYFLVEGDVAQTLAYNGPLPEYQFFEPKRTSEAEWQEMAKEFKEKAWCFLEVSKKYIKGDCVALFQILIRYFETLVNEFPINPIRALSVPSLAFKTWRTVQLPKLNKEGFKVYDLARTLDAELRGAYLGGIVDVYRPHLNNIGYYYDVNSLYPTAMCRPMPVDLPTPVNLSPKEFIDSDFFGYVWARVQAPSPETPGGYIGLLPIRMGGRLICPGGNFEGVFFSEEIRFALANGYELIEIRKAYSFQRGENTFYDLIQTLNTLKVEAQRNEQPTKRNLAKLLMNSMYGRFGMHTDNLRHAFVDPEGLNQLENMYAIINLIELDEMFMVSYALTELVKNISQNPSTPVFKKFIKGMTGETNVAIAAAITSYSRMIINQYKLDAMALGLKVYYSDTDSLVLNGSLPPEYIDSATLGKLKLEHIIKEGLFVMPKVYYLETEEGEIVTKCKGYPGKLSKGDYLGLLEGRSLELRVNKWERSLKAGSVKIKRNTPYKINPLFNKRTKVFDFEGKWVNTTPLILNP